MESTALSGACTWMSSIIWSGYSTASSSRTPGFQREFAALFSTPVEHHPRNSARRYYAENSDGIKRVSHFITRNTAAGTSPPKRMRRRCPRIPWSRLTQRGAERSLPTLPPRIPTPFADTLSTCSTTTRSPPSLMSSSEYSKSLTHNEIRAPVVQYMETLLSAGSHPRAQG